MKLLQALVVTLSLSVFTLPGTAVASGEKPDTEADSAQQLDAHVKSTERAWSFGAELVTDFPIQVGAGFHAETPQGIRLHTSVGLLPSPYLDTINAFCEALDWYEPLTSDLITAALENSLVLQVRLGWKPWAEYGFYFYGGYGLAALGGGLSGAEVLSALTGVNLNAPALANRAFNVDSTLHMANVEVGWEWMLNQNLALRVSLGGAFTVGSKTEVKPSWTPMPAAQNAVQNLAKATEVYLDDVYAGYVHTIVLSVAAGWRF